MESISRISSLLESARELTLDAASAAASRGSRTSTRPPDKAQIKRLLDSRNEREVLDGLRKVIAMMYRSQNILQFFSSVVKNVASPNLEIKKLVYIYLLHHAEQEPDLALLSINTIQKSLSDGNPQVRALALRTMSGIRVPVISQIVSLAIKKGVGDMSPYVRRAAALAIPKCHRLDPTQLPQLLEYLTTLLGDKQYYVAGAAVTAFLEVCPDRLDLIHKHYRALVRKVVDMDEWSQLSTLRLMTVYGRKCFPRRTRTVKIKTVKNHTPDLQDFYGEGDGTNSPDKEGTDGEKVVILDPDLELFLNSIKPLLHSRNSAVIVSVARSFIALGTDSHISSAIGPLIALLRGPQDTQQAALYSIVSVCLSRPAEFARYATHCLVRGTDTPEVWELKLEVLTLIFPHATPHVKSLILSELEHFSRGGFGSQQDRELMRAAVRAIGRCAQADAAASRRCLRLLLGQITSLDGTLAAESLTVIRHLIQRDPSSHLSTVVRLARNLDSATDPLARATIVWLVGEFAGINDGDNVAADVLRILLKDFANEAEVTKRQILLLAAKVHLHHLNRTAGDDSAKKEQKPSVSGEPLETEGWGAPDESEAQSPKEPEEAHPTAILWDYTLVLVRYDTSYDLRDRARMYRALLGVPQLATLMLLAPKPAPQAPSPSEVRKGYTLGSAALVLAGGGGVHGLRGYEPLPDWVEDGKEPDPMLREGDGAVKSTYGETRSVPAAESLDSAVGSSMPTSKAVKASNGMGEKSLDDWLAESEHEEEEEDDDSGESEEESSDEEEEEEEEDDEDDSDEEESNDDQGEGDRLVGRS
ncbi:hypothetical protein MCOR27_005005 [Pyricularia oryzae]|uniref:Clathrin/coatomer adaptor adaptin-like N-terminal domain-containing protein n=2 Tax=Pyricularia TaxID=48558 RepID=A0ABQ8NZP4_PYRGI|nr:hypothetical protein MCOR01_008492 [Pyricularia oryzae]KAI6303150.1 hypothetical protein MCOR33_001599 [Pyricularia grisea]KAI6255637.1 hypothetical protein MCOR19_007889 [Pyricularia oryzae]KAI6278316.1 hypothetical protein MCOR26_004727 [Pyricularia oryzae]KAI6279670.1 hypothetical protein MCOR27_005005 [Pyricularia oryzae]